MTLPCLANSLPRTRPAELSLVLNIWLPSSWETSPSHVSQTSRLTADMSPGPACSWRGDSRGSWNSESTGEGIWRSGPSLNPTQLSVRFWWSHPSPGDLCFLIYEPEVGTEMIPNTGWAQKGPGSLLGLWGRGEPIKTAIPHLSQSSDFSSGDEGWGTKHMPGQEHVFFCLEGKPDSRCSIYIFSNDNWMLRMISAFYEMCQNDNKISNLHHPPTHWSSFQKPLLSSVVQDEKDNEGKA